MLHIVLLILKIIGIAVSIIIGLIVLLIAVILFTPVRYMAVFSRDENCEQIMNGNARISWLLRAFSLRAEYKEDGFSYSFRILGIRFDWLMSALSNRRERRENARSIKHNKKALKAEKKRLKKLEAQRIKKEKQMFKEVPKKYRRYLEQQDNKDSDYLKTEESDDMQISKSDIDVETYDDYDETYENDRWFGFLDKLTKIMEMAIKLFVMILMLPLTIVKFIDKIIRMIRHLFSNMSTVASKCIKIKDFFVDKRNANGIKLIRETLGSTWGHIKPREFICDIRYGTGDPASTGQLLGIIAATNGIHKDFINVSPDFDNKTLYVKLKMKGRIRLINLVIMYAKLYFNDVFKRLLRRFNKLKEEIMNGR